MRLGTLARTSLLGELVGKATLFPRLQLTDSSANMFDAKRIILGETNDAQRDE